MTLILPKHQEDYLQNNYNDADIDGLLNVCTYFDPRFKSMYIDDDVDTALVNDRLAQENVEIIESRLVNLLLAIQL